jgi:hypothetical protein
VVHLIGSSTVFEIRRLSIFDVPRRAEARVTELRQGIAVISALERRGMPAIEADHRVASLPEGVHDVHPRH